MLARVPESPANSAEISSAETLGLDASLLSERRSARVLRNLELVLPVAGVVFVVLACFLGPVIFPVTSPSGAGLAGSMLPPLSAGHIFGTDPLGNDILSRILYGGRVSIEVGLGSCALGFAVGGLLGILAGFKAGWTDVVVMRILDIFLSFPSLVLAIMIATYLGASELHVIWAISFFSVPGFARLARAHTLRLREQVFIQAARLSGTSDRRIILRHLVPNVLPGLVTFSFIFVGIAIVLEAGLSFLGLGVPPPAPTWGNMISVGQAYLGSDPYLVLIPAACLFFTVTCLNLAGDALRARWSSA
jgi:peptide/nickel transport system permease protein